MDGDGKPLNMAMILSVNMAREKVKSTALNEAPQNVAWIRMESKCSREQVVVDMLKLESISAPRCHY